MRLKTQTKQILGDVLSEGIRQSNKQGLYNINRSVPIEPMGVETLMEGGIILSLRQQYATATNQNYEP